MRILFFTHYGELYGANRSLLALLKELVKRNIQVHVLVRGTSRFVTQLQRLGISYHVIYFQHGVHKSTLKHPSQKPFYKRNSILKVLRNGTFIPRIHRIVKAFNPDVIHSNASTINLGLFISKLYRKPHVWHIREFLDLDYNLQPDFGFRFLYALLKRSEAVVYVSNALADYYHYYGLNAQVVYNGVLSENNITHYPKKTKQGASDPFVLGMVGLISKEKGHFDVLKTLPLLETDKGSTRLHFYGQGNEKKVRAYAEEYDMEDQVLLRGYYDNPSDIYKECDAVIVASRNEAMGRVTAEAMLHATPVIGFNSAGTAELIEHRKTGLLYNTGDELVECLRILQTDPVIYYRLVKNALEFGRAHFTNEIYASKVVEIYSNLISNN